MTRRGQLTWLTGAGLAGLVAAVLSTPTWDSSGDTNRAPVSAPMSPVSGDVGAAIAISGTCSDDGKPLPSAISFLWEQRPGCPGTCTPASPTSNSTTATCDAAGACTLRLHCCDKGAAATCAANGGLSDYEDVVVTAIAPFEGVVDDIVAAGDAVPNACGSYTHRIKASHTGPIVVIQRADNNAQASIGVGGDNRLNEAAIVTHCTSPAVDCRLRVIEDQCGGNFDWTAGSAGTQPKIFDGATQQVLMLGDLPWPAFTSLTALARADIVGLTGASAVTLAYFASTTDVSLRRAWLAVGGGGNARFAGGSEATTGDIQNSSASTVRRTFTEITALSTPTMLIHQIAGGAGMSTSTAYQNGTGPLTEATVQNGGNTVTFTTGSTVIGADISGDNAVGGGAFWLVSGTAYGAPARTAINDFGATLSTLAGL